jgi:1-acyl-sn-glycerol-3-phosphate acyltransferase
VFCCGGFCWLQDIYSLFHLQRPFKFISKTSNFLIPIVGWSMFLTGGRGDN